MPDVKISPASIVIGLAMILILGVFGWLTFGPKPPPPPPPVLTAEAKQYLNNLALTNVHMQAAESMVNQRVVEILGDITNKGDKTVKLAEVTCVFRDYYGKEMKRERVPIVGQRRDAGAGRHEAVPAGFRRSGGHVESGAAGAGDRADSV